MELQADCYAGVWASRARNSAGQPVMEPGDMEEAMRAANAIGDDTLMRSAGQRPVPESFTHGTSEQRMSWLRRGLQSGDPRQRSEEHTSELQSLMRISYAVFCLKKKTQPQTKERTTKYPKAPISEINYSTQD